MDYDVGIVRRRRIISPDECYFSVPAAVSGGVFTDFIHEYPLDDSHAATGAGNIKDVVTSPLTATLSGGVTSTSTTGIPSAQFATARAFDGVSGSSILVDGANSLFDWNSGSFSVGMWVYITNNNAASAGGSDQYYIHDANSSGSNYFLMHNRVSPNAGGLVVSVSGGSGGTALGVPTGAVPNNTWTHLVYTNSGGGFAGNTTSNAAFYVNTVPAAIFTGGAGDLSFGGLSLVCRLGSGIATDGMLAGRLYKVVVYNRVLAQADVTALYNSG
jgi:hypothetical protein